VAREMRSFSQEFIHGRPDLAAIFDGRRVTAPTSVVGYGFFRSIADVDV
jgi:hypothetical protein